MAEGWVKIHRALLDWEWYQDIPVKVLFLHLLLDANHKDGKWKGHLIKRGQVLTGRIKLAEETGLSEKQIRTALKKLEKSGDLAIKAATKFSMITICNYDKYQDEEKDKGQQQGQQGANKGPEEGQQGATNKNEKKKENEKKEEPPEPKNKFSAEDMKFAEWMLQKITDLGTKPKANMNSWADTIRLMRERDNLSHRQIGEVFSWANNDAFWQVNILSPKKLREKFTQLSLKANQQQQPKQPAVSKTGVGMMALEELKRRAMNAAAMDSSGSAERTGEPLFLEAELLPTGRDDPEDG